MSSEMNLVKRDGFEVIGVSARTTNEEEMGPNGRIPGLWQKVFAEEALGKIPNRLDSEILTL